MSITGILGLVGGFACIIIGILQNGVLSDYIDASSIFITIGGTICAVLASYPIKQVLTAIKAFGIAFKEDKRHIVGTIDMIIDMANSARKEGLLSLDNMLEDITDPYLKKGVMLVVDGSDPELVKSVLETEIYYMEARHQKSIGVFQAAAAYAPAFGMIGTLIGLINMLVNLDQAATLGSAMSVALVTTFYGCIMANLVFMPMARKLSSYSDDERLQKEMILEGILSIQEGENPRIIRDKLESFIAHSQIVPSQDQNGEGEEMVNNG